MSPRGFATTQTARLVIVDDNELVRSGIKLMLSGEPKLSIVGEAVDGQDAIELCHRMRPEIVLMDVRMPRMDGLAATRAIKQELPNTSVLILTVHENEDYLLEALRAGASGYVLKDAPQQVLTTAIRKILCGETTLNRDLATRLLRRLADDTWHSRGVSLKQTRAQLPQRLSPREVEVLDLLALGLTNREIAQDLVISVGTVKRHIENISAKLVVSDRTQAVVRALEMGFISFPKR